MSTTPQALDSTTTTETATMEQKVEHAVGEGAAIAGTFNPAVGGAIAAGSMFLPMIWQLIGFLTHLHKQGAPISITGPVAQALSNAHTSAQLTDMKLTAMKK